MLIYDDLYWFMMIYADYLQVITFWRRLGLQCYSPSLWRSLTPRFSACNDDDDINDNEPAKLSRPNHQLLRSMNDEDDDYYKDDGYIDDHNDNDDDDDNDDGDDDDDGDLLLRHDLIVAAATAPLHPSERRPPWKEL